MNLLITGGLGFIGSNLIRYFLDKYPAYRIINLDAISWGAHLESLADREADPRYTFIQGSISDKALVNEIFSGERFGPIEGVINLAAESHVDRSIFDPSIFVQTNVAGTQVLLGAALRFIKKDELGRFRFLQVSTDEVYGSLGQAGYFTEERPLRPNNPYAATKAAADLLCRAYFHTYSLPVVTTRASNTYGPYQDVEKFIPLTITALLNDRPVPIYGDGLNVRDWLHITDHCLALDLALHGGRPGEVYNIGARSERTNLEIAKMILHLLGKSESLLTFVDDRLGHDRRYAIDPTKIERELGWSPKTNFNAGLLETIQWYEVHRSWWNG